MLDEAAGTVDDLDGPALPRSDGPGITGRGGAPSLPAGDEVEGPGSRGVAAVASW